MQRRDNGSIAQWMLKMKLPGGREEEDAWVRMRWSAVMTPFLDLVLFTNPLYTYDYRLSVPKRDNRQAAEKNATIVIFLIT